MSGAFSMTHVLVVAIAVLVLFGRGKVAGFMGEFGQGLSAFKKGVRDAETDDTPAAAPRVSDN